MTLCHRTGSATNPYIQITVDIASSGYVKGGHTGHEQVGNGLGSDIIPPYIYTAKDGSVFEFGGFGLDQVIGGATGAEILEAGCVVPTPTVTPTPPPPTCEELGNCPTPPPTTNCHESGTCWTPSWTPTWTPSWEPKHDCDADCNPQKGGNLAMTGSDPTVPLGIGAGLLALGLGSLYWARRRSA